MSKQRFPLYCSSMSDAENKNVLFSIDVGYYILWFLFFFPFLFFFVEK
jgi:hypothetical protein